jgi:predicted amidohydrolase YtcJ
VVLSADPTAVSPEELKGIRVEKTIIGGEIVWER